MYDRAEAGGGDVIRQEALEQRWLLDTKPGGEVFAMTYVEKAAQCGDCGGRSMQAWGAAGRMIH